MERKFYFMTKIKQLISTKCNNWINSQNLVKTSNIKQKHSLKVERWNHLSEGIKNTTIVNHFENRICDRKRSNVPLLHSHLEQQESIKTCTNTDKITEGYCQSKHSNITFSSIKQCRSYLKDIRFSEHKFSQHLFL